MNEHRRKILDMLAGGQITAEEAERLLAALEKEPAESRAGEAETRPKPAPKYLRVLVEDKNPRSHNGHEGPTRVNVRVPMQLLRAGVRLAGLIPPHALQHANEAMREQGVPIDLTKIKPENLEELVDQLSELTVDADDHGTTVRVFCE